MLGYIAAATLAMADLMNLTREREDGERRRREQFPNPSGMAVASRAYNIGEFEIGPLPRQTVGVLVGCDRISATAKWYVGAQYELNRSQIFESRAASEQPVRIQ